MIEDHPGAILWRLTWDGMAYAMSPHSFPGQILDSLDGVSLLLPVGAYTTFRTYGHTGCLRFQDHLDRLVDSAKRAGVQVDLHGPALRTVLREIIRHSPFPEARIRISLDLTAGQIFVNMEELHILPAEAYAAGVKVLSTRLHRDNPKAKLTNFIATAAGYRAHLPSGINELLMISPEGFILEGLSSNFFGVCAGVLCSADQGVLLGITRTILLDLARADEIPVDPRAIRYDDWATLDECFITSASRGVLPVIQMDGHRIGSGHPGPVTRKLMEKFSAWVQNAAEEI